MNSTLIDGQNWIAASEKTGAAVVEEAGEGVPAAFLLKHVVDGLGDGVVLRHPGALGPHPVVQVIDHRAHQPLACVKSCCGGQASDLALDIEDGIDAFDRLQRDGRYIFSDRSALPGGGLDVGQFEELPPCVAPA